MDEAAGYELAYAEALRALSQQQGALAGLRSRAGLLLSAAAIATSFLGGQALKGRGLAIWSWIATACFVGLAICALVVLWPRKDWAFAAAPSEVISAYIETEEPLGAPMIQRDLALHMENSYVRNDRFLSRLIASLQVGSILLIAEVAAWVVELAAA